MNRPKMFVSDKLHWNRGGYGKNCTLHTTRPHWQEISKFHWNWTTPCVYRQTDIGRTIRVFAVTSNCHCMKSYLQLVHITLDSSKCSNQIEYTWSLCVLSCKINQIRIVIVIYYSLLFSLSLILLLFSISLGQIFSPKVIVWMKFYRLSNDI